ncbi:MAG: hypothetical protein KF745_08710 [Phycisphaeraceae bacterium]|nr:hypothetical protein [Phycisphaeraceae bacterium]
MGSDAPLMVSVSGCRGIVGESLTPEVAARYAGAFGGWLCERAGGAATVVLGRDGRAGGRIVRDAAAAGLAAAGCEVIDLGVAMTPTVGVMTDQHAADGGMVITASHNPQQWNGLKCIVRERGLRSATASASAPAADVAAQIKDRFREGRIGLAPWDRLRPVETDTTAVTVHTGKVLRAIGDVAAIARRGFRVVLDSVNCSGAIGGAALLDALGCDVVHLGDRDTGLFPHPPEPIKEHLGSLCAAVKQHGAAVGFAQDPDADRLAIVDERGEFIGEEYTLALAAMEILHRRAARSPGATMHGVGEPAMLVANLSTSRMIDDVVSRLAGAGSKVFRAAVGEANVVEVMKREGATFGGEGNGGVIWQDVTYIRDSLSAMALVLSLMQRDGRKISQIVRDIPAYAIEKRKVDLKPGMSAAPALEAIAKAYARERLDRQDGVRVDFDAKRAWLHVRASNTEPIMRLIAEAPTPEEARAVLDKAGKVIA